MTHRPRFTCPRCGRTVAARGSRPEAGDWLLTPHQRPDGRWCIARTAADLVPADTPPVEDGAT